MQKQCRLRLVCPECRTALVEESSGLVCRSCSRAATLGEMSVPDFVGRDFYWGEVPRDLMVEINEGARARGWAWALTNVLEPQHPEIYQYVVDQCRADWRVIVHPFGGRAALDLGSGWGTISFLLAPHYETVVAVEAVAERAEFTALRAAQTGTDNLRVVRADVSRLPLPEDRFDLVVMNGILEWVALEDDGRDPRVVQLDVLRSVRELMAPGGWLYIGIENRFGYSAFRGARDHSGLPFTSLMPRRMASAICRWFGPDYRTSSCRRAYRTYTYSMWGYRTLLAEAGFEEVHQYSVWPSYNRPAYMLEVGDRRAFSYLFRQMITLDTAMRRAAARLVRLSPLDVQWLAPHFAVFARGS